MKILIVDTSSVLHAAKHSMKKTKLNHNNKHSFVIFGFLLKMQFIIKKTYPDIVVFALDSKESKRKELFPWYKEKRSSKADKTEEEIKFDQICYDQFNDITDNILPSLGYRNIFKCSGYEADDIIASICKKYKTDDITIVTNDNDMYQLLSENVNIFFPYKNRYYTKHHFIAEHGIIPNKWKKVKCLAGCTGDEVPGINGVGVKTAIKYIKGKLPEHYKTFKDIESEEGQRIRRRNRKLVVLPFKNTPHYQIKPNHVTRNRIKAVAEDYGLQSVLNDLPFWENALKFS